MTSRPAADRQIKDDRWAVPQFAPERPGGPRRPNYNTDHVTVAARASGSDRSPTDGDRDASDLDRLAASLDALALCYCELDAAEVDYGDGTEVDQVREVVAMPTQSFMVPGAFEPDAVAAMSEALEAACEVLQDAGECEVMREIIAKRIVAAATVVGGQALPDEWSNLSGDASNISA
jgi:hypothetical protein